MVFKVGDTIRVIQIRPASGDYEKYLGCVSVITGVSDKGVVISIDKDNFLYNDEIELAIQVGEQLEFAFMREGSKNV